MHFGTMNNTQKKANAPAASGGDRRNNNFASGAQPSSAPNKQLEQKLFGALQSLRRERDQEYREKAEAEERLRLVDEEHQTIAKIVTDLKAKHGKLTKDKETVQASLGPLETQVNDLTGKVRRATTIGLFEPATF